MPRTISRSEALELLGRQRRADGCLLCALRDGELGSPLLIAESEHTVVLLPRYATRWGHLMVVLRRHVTTFAELSDEAWREATTLALAAARTIEATLSPLRCYVASLGAPRGDLPMTSPHLHLHVIPIYDHDDKPATVLTWSNGVLVADEPEWEALRQQLRDAWPT